MKNKSTQKNNFRQFFAGKKITVMGLGILGRGLGYTKFMAECGADLIVTDLKTKKELASSIKELGKFKNIQFVLGEHRLEDFRNRDMILKAAGVPMNSPFIEEARQNSIPIEMDVSFFAKLSPSTILVGVTGTRGKSMTTALIYEILRKNEKVLKGKVYLGGNMRGIATLPLLRKTSLALGKTIVVCELDSWQLQGFGDAKISPQVSVFTSFMPDHMNYYKDDLKKYFNDKANIFKYQKKGDLLVVRPLVRKLIPKNLKSTLLVVDPKTAQKYEFVVPGTHQRENLACAIEVAKYFKIPKTNIEKAVKNFKGLEGRMQYLLKINGVKIYNDNNATTPEATIAGIEALVNEKIILISGGSDKGLDTKKLVGMMEKNCKKVILLTGTGTAKLPLISNSIKVKSLNEAVRTALKEAKKGDIILFSPAFASFGPPPGGFKNEYDRGDQFIDIVKRI
ncbi:MAG TPA: UDP-N-acetylmuramoyl-L-alanine--D-glutamate ligase [Candidatus Paceibacterota bacterium]|nr:UDP-N-acetylmuramoyl-L-alanine--D-glutamate ligase [Candidatus Paceibacterota bacterium]